MREALLASAADARALHAALGWHEDWRRLEFRTAKPHEGLPQQDKSQTESASALGAVFSANRSTYAMVRISEGMWQRMGNTAGAFSTPGGSCPAAAKDTW